LTLRTGDPRYWLAILVYVLSTVLLGWVQLEITFGKFSSIA
jgi:hypothetical protein